MVFALPQEVLCPMTIVELYITLAFAVVCGAATGAWFYGLLGVVGGAVAGLSAALLLLVVFGAVNRATNCSSASIGSMTTNTSSWRPGIPGQRVRHVRERSAAGRLGRGCLR